MTFPFLILVASWSAYAASRRPALRRCKCGTCVPYRGVLIRRVGSGPRVTSVPCGVMLAVGLESLVQVGL